MGRDADADVARSVSVTADALVRQSNPERRPLVGPALGPHPPAMPGNDPLDDGEPDPGTWELGAMETLEDAEELVDILHVEAGAVIADEIHRLAGAGGAADLDPRLRFHGWYI